MNEPLLRHLLPHDPDRRMFVPLANGTLRILFVHAIAGHWAITREWGTLGYSITHVPSGKRLPGFFDSVLQGELLLVALARLDDPRLADPALDFCETATRDLGKMILALIEQYRQPPEGDATQLTLVESSE